MIGILDYGVGNVGAFLRIFHNQNIKAIPIKVSKDFSKIDKLILPGVGSFDGAMSKLNNSGLRSELDKFVLENEKPLLGVCIGMHMLGLSSEEGSEKGLGYIKGHTVHIGTKTPRVMLPHMGWNNITINSASPIWTDINLQEGFYFLHSFVFEALDQNSIFAVTTYHDEIVCAVKNKNIYGFQFHPEKSLGNGIQLLTNFAVKL